MSKFTLFASCIALFFVMVAMGPTVLPALRKPVDLGYIWLEGFVDDYVGYVSYVKEGMEGRNFFAIRSLPKAGQEATTAHLLYLTIGRIGGFLGLDAPVSYHLGRGIISFFFILMMINILRLVSPTPLFAILTAVLSLVATSVSWFRWDGARFVLETVSRFSFTENVTIRAVSRPHYDFAGLLFLVIAYILLTKKRSPRSTVLVAALSLVLATVHPAIGVVLWIVAFLLVVTSRSTRFLPVIAGAGAGLLLSYWSTHRYPYTAMLSFESYVTSQTVSLSQIFSDVLSFGPVFWLGVPGLIAALASHKRDRSWYAFFFFWFVVHMILFFFLFPLFRAERFRFLQTLYWVPMAYGASFLLWKWKQKIWIAGMAILLLLSLPTYTTRAYYGWKAALTQQSFDAFVFPSQKAMESYRFLDTRTEKESTVLAPSAPGSHILLYSHNFVIGNRQGWPAGAGQAMEQERDRFYSGAMNDQQALRYLTTNDVSYVYANKLVRSYPFLSPVFENSEAILYRVVRTS